MAITKEQYLEGFKNAFKRNKLAPVISIVEKVRRNQEHKPSKYRSKLHDKHEIIVASYLLDHKSVKEIAKELSCDPKSIRDILKKHNAERAAQ